MHHDVFVNGSWERGSGLELVSFNPSNQQEVWSGRTASAAQVQSAFEAARIAQPKWWKKPAEERVEICRRFAEIVKAKGDELALLISQETGKTLWESRGEVATVVGKIELSIDSIQTRRGTQNLELGGNQAVIRYHPHGVLTVLGPYNFPAHLPNGHIVPALLAGNSLVFKPSELTPAVGAWMITQWSEAGLPAGVLNLVQGGRETGAEVANHPFVDGLLFTGSNSAGKALHRAFAEHPQKILALEMGGNNPLVVFQASQIAATAYLAALSAFITSGQRCTCARRLIVVADQNTDRFLEQLVQTIGRMNVGYYSDTPEPFMGTVINRFAGSHIQGSFDRLVSQGATVLTKMTSKRDNPALLSPGLLDVTHLAPLPDEEIFGPLLSIQKVASFDEAIREANRTKYGLSAGLLSDSQDAWEQFVAEIRAGIINWNRQTTGASGRLPFGGCGQSGNHRPAGYFSADYCSYPIGSLQSNKLEMPSKLEIGISP